MHEGGSAAFDKCLRIEFRIVNRVLKGTDFFEGVRAAIIDKDNRPQWSPETIAEVTDAEIDGYFAPLGAKELTFA